MFITRHASLKNNRCLFSLATVKSKKVGISGAGPLSRHPFSCTEEKSFNESNRRHFTKKHDPKLISDMSYFVNELCRLGAG